MCEHFKAIGWASGNIKMQSMKPMSLLDLILRTNVVLQEKSPATFRCRTVVAT